MLFSNQLAARRIATLIVIFVKLRKRHLPQRGDQEVSSVKGKTPELPGALPPGPHRSVAPGPHQGPLGGPRDPTRDGSHATACSTWFSPAASTFLTDTFSKMTGNFKILAKAQPAALPTAANRRQLTSIQLRSNAAQ